MRVYECLREWGELRNLKYVLRYADGAMVFRLQRMAEEWYPR